MIYATESERLEEHDVPPEILVPSRGGQPTGHEEVTLKERLAEAERRIIEDALLRNRGNKTETARDLGLADHASLIKKMKRLGM